MFKIATWNVNSLRVRLSHVLDWLNTEKPDVLALQETKTVDADFPLEPLQEAGYEVVFAGQKTYNGVAVLSKKPVTDIVTDFPGFDDPQRRILGVTVGDVRVLDLYVPNGSSLESDKYQYKLAWLESLIAYVTEQRKQYERFIILGDFNIAPEDRDVHDPEAWVGSVLVSEPERAALQALLDLGFKDTFREFDQEEKIYSWWDYRMLGFRRNRGLRIDLILSSLALAEKSIACVVDKTPRRWERPSDHAPVIAEFDI